MGEEEEGGGGGGGWDMRNVVRRGGKKHDRVRWRITCHRLVNFRSSCGNGKD